MYFLNYYSVYIDEKKYSDSIRFERADSNAIVYDIAADSSEQKMIDELGDVHFELTCTLDTEGFIASTSFKGNLPKYYIDRINYYLSRLSHLYTGNEGAGPSNSLTLYYLSKTFLVVDGEKSFPEWALSESVKPLASSKLYESASSPYTVKTFAKPAVGFESWSRYINQHTRSLVPVDNGAPHGDYLLLVYFTVDEHGEITNLKVPVNPGFGMAEEALRVVSHAPSAWIPATLNNIPVPSIHVASVGFRVK